MCIFTLTKHTVCFYTLDAWFFSAVHCWANELGFSSFYVHHFKSRRVVIWQTRIRRCILYTWYLSIKDYWLHKRSPIKLDIGINVIGGIFLSELIKTQHNSFLKWESATNFVLLKSQVTHIPHMTKSENYKTRNNGETKIIQVWAHERVSILSCRLSDMGLIPLDNLGLCSYSELQRAFS